MKILINLWKFLKLAFSKKYLPITMGVIIIILILLYANSCNKNQELKLENKRTEAMYQNNLDAMNDSLKTYYDAELGRQITEKTAFLIKGMDDLKNYNEDMYKELGKMKNVIAGIQSDVGVIIPELTSEIRNTKQDPNDSTKFDLPFSFPFTDDGLNFTLNGFSKVKVKDNYPTLLFSKLDTSKFNIKLTYAMTEDDNKYTVKATSPSPLVVFNEVNGAMQIDKVVPEPYTPNPWSFGPSATLGLNTDLTGQNSRFGWSLGFSATYDLFNKTQNKKVIRKFFRKTVN